VAIEGRARVFFAALARALEEREPRAHVPRTTEPHREQLGALFAAGARVSTHARVGEELLGRGAVPWDTEPGVEQRRLVDTRRRQTFAARAVERRIRRAGIRR
jgi:hypothetical protein